MGEEEEEEEEEDIDGDGEQEEVIWLNYIFSFFTFRIPIDCGN